MEKTNELDSLVALREKVVNKIRKLESDIKNLPYSDNPEVYAQINSIEYFNRKFYITGDLFTKELLSFDKLYYSEYDRQIFSSYREELRPIIWEFETIITLESLINPNNQRDVLLKKLHDYVSENSNMSIENIDIIHNKTFKLYNNNLERISSEFYNYFMKIRFDNKKGYNTIIGFAASPFKTYRTYITFIDDALTQKADNDPLPTIASLSHADIPTTIKNFKPKLLREFNVGQGNFSELDSDNNKIVFDVGFTKGESHKKYSLAVSELKSVDAECFLLSHYDTDHILGTIYLKDNQFQQKKLWIAPDPTNIKILKASAKRLIWYLYNSCKFRIITNSRSQNVFNLNKNIKIYRGTANHNIVKENSKYINGSGIMLWAKGKNKDILLSGDCLYDYWGKRVPRKCDYFVVPHHGCKVNNVEMQGRKSSEPEAIIPVGKNRYNHPNQKHISDLMKNNFNIILTKHIKSKTYNLD